MTKEYLKIRDGLYVDLEDFYEKVCIPRGVHTVEEDLEEEIEEND